MEGQLGDVLDGDCLLAGNDGAIADCGHDKEPMDSCLAWPNSLFYLDDMSSDVASCLIALCMDFKFTLKTVDCFSFSACVVFFIYWSGERGNLHHLAEEAKPHQNHHRRLTRQETQKTFPKCIARPTRSGRQSVPCVWL
jgi:hypothetical protein